MDEELFQEVQYVINKTIRKRLRKHGGDLELLSVDGDVVYVRFLGACRNCKALQYTVENIVEPNILGNVKSIGRIVYSNSACKNMCMHQSSSVFKKH